MLSVYCKRFENFSNMVLCRFIGGEHMDTLQEKAKYGLIPVERRKQIVAYVMKHESAQVKELAELFDEVSEATIRRDLELLATEGKLTRTHGGAASISTRTAFEQLYLDKCAMAVDEKRRIAKLLPI
ncbi:DeoR/GlpR transcriptional regulator [Cohnella faecalis]|uniref:DeoR/GlpR transcriptional regulator n=2 Tax=Cohnella faecalis TaxID=2315694 RepID=A0A398CLK8_9BACL|nr:DeoR/GlpR transcriptional regulator [Cohnella faecalis]